MKLHNLPTGVALWFADRGEYLEVDVLIVDQTLRGRGLGTKAIQALQKIGREIQLTAVPDERKKAALHRFYRHLGFRPFGKAGEGFTVFRWLPGGAK